MSGLDSRILRIMDANFNRSREGLRVCEDVARFILNSSVIAKDLKSARHAISTILMSIPPEWAGLLVDSRDSKSDVGSAVHSTSEMSRKSPCDIFCANIERVKESLRVLEEFSKILDAGMSRKFSTLRFKIYDIEKR
ncbi:MAG: thiamine phosphate synthase, partial [Candidatus Omnitrophota bacterium]